MRLRCCYCPVGVFGGLAGGVSVEFIMSCTVLFCWSGSFSESACLFMLKELFMFCLLSADMLKGDTSCRGCI